MDRCRCALVFASLAIFMAGLPSAAIAQTPATQPTSAVSGKVSAPGEVPLSEMVAYLESPEAKRVIDVPALSVKVSQKGAKFSPALIIVSVGQTVEFLNDEDHLIEHNVFSNAPPKRFDLGIFRPGESRSVTFDKPGAVFLYCSIHRYMDGVVYVTPTPFASRIANDGTYKIENVPAGIWVVKTWQRRRRFTELSIPILVEGGKPITADLELRKPWNGPLV
jgi:plastocyanin